MHIRTAHVLGNSCKWGECQRKGDYSNLKRHANGDRLCIKWRCPLVKCDLLLSRVGSLVRHLKTKHYCVSGDGVEGEDDIESARSSLRDAKEALRPLEASEASRKRVLDEDLDQSARKRPNKRVRSQ
ncbi:uncharacterized protein LAESUDRAFT_732005 [Laetiporus sulphureus 93-53]|uniref:C2H2-type domain-containing protein n=1 Tax=Laetiporus sulphureus 93-53 TaxID=1314785 RepID=A0A165BBU7_9APHY|nr:uncharacterized protein LAESUDRAFT_732005 [Laetiporus sulphureus 93-53]KZT00695.1 hypothetical protein LAESUDRAFT_732005 [Laetiporus sulphureus 93-53]